MKIVFILLFLLTSCSTQNEAIFGLYQTKHNTKLYLNSDSTFTYESHYDMISGETYGGWDVIENKLILKSAPEILKDTTPKFNILDIGQIDNSGITIDLFWPDSTKVLFGAEGAMFLNNDTIDKQTSDINGRMFFKEQKADSIKIYFPGFKDISLGDFDKNYYKIAAVEKPLPPFDFFKNEIWKVYRNRIKDTSTKRIFIKQKN